jgi:hypothetical protein
MTVIFFSGTVKNSAGRQIGLVLAQYSLINLSFFNS